MAGEDQDSRTEEATSKRLEKAVEDGEVLQSQEVKTAAQILGITVAVWLLLPFLLPKIATYLSRFLGNADQLRILTDRDFMNIIAGTVFNIGLYVGIIMAVLLAFALAASIGQIGFNITTKKLVPDIERISPMAGLKRIFSSHSLMELAKNLAKLAIVGTLAYLLLVPKAKTLDLLVTMELRPTLDYLHSTLLTLLMFVVALVASIGIVDWIFQRYQYLKKMRMTKQEVKDEYKQNEGDPMIRSRLRAIRMARARQRMMAAVPGADVVVTNPTHYACALKYDAEKMNAPVLVAKGQDLVAARIRDVARDHDVPIVENPPLARALHASLEIDDEIHPDHYKAVAEVISYVMRLKEKKLRRR